MSAVQNKLSQMMACPTAMLWAKDYEDPLEAWNQCDRGDWMLWLLEQLKYDKAIIDRMCCDCCFELVDQLFLSDPSMKCKTTEEFDVMELLLCAEGDSASLPEMIDRLKLSRVKDVSTQLSWAKAAAICLYDVIYKDRKDKWFVFYYAARSDRFYKAQKLCVPCTAEDSLRNYSRLVRKHVDPEVLLTAWNAWSK